MYDRFYQTKNYGDKKNAVFLDNTYMKAIAELIAYSILKAMKRGACLYWVNTSPRELSWYVKDVVTGWSFEYKY